MPPAQPRHRPPSRALPLLAGCAACLLLLAGCAAPAPTPKAPPAPKDIRPVPLSFLEELVVRRRVAGLAMRVYNTGKIRTRGGAVSSMKSWAARVALDAPAFMIRHPEEGVILFDTGLSTWTARSMAGGLLERFFVKPVVEPGQDIASQLRADGVAAGDVKWVILSHLHMDHAGLAEAFPAATVVVSRREWEGQRARLALKPDKAVLSPAAVEKRLRLRFVDFDAAGPFGAFDRGLDFFSDGTVFLVHLPGHTDGAMGAWVNMDAGPVLLTGDAAWVIDNYMDLALPVGRSMADLAAYWRSLHMIRAMLAAVPRLVVLPGHDLMPLMLANRPDLPLAPFPRR